MNEWHHGPQRHQEQPSLIGLHALAVSRHAIEGRKCDTCEGPLRYLVIAWTTRGRPVGTERLTYCTACDDISEPSGPWASGPST